MANFAVAADENVIARGNRIIEKLQEPGEKKGATLNRIFDLVEAGFQEEKLRQGGVDTKALEASLTNIRNLFETALSGREEIQAEYDRKLSAYKKSTEEKEEEYRQKLSVQSQKNQELIEEYNTLKKLYDTIQDAKKSSDDQLSTFSALIKEKEKANVLLLEKLHELEGKVKDAEQLREENADLSRQINALLLNQKEKEKELMSFQKKMDEMENEIEKAKADLMAARSDRANMEKELSSCKENLTALKQELAICEKEAALKQEQAVISKEREMYHKTEELQKKLDETKEENYKLRLTIARFDNPDKRNEDRNHETN